MRFRHLRLTGPSVVLIACGAIAGSAQLIAITPEQNIAVGQDVTGGQDATQRVVTHRSHRNDTEELIIETYSPSIQWGRLALSRRVRRTTSVTSDGSLTVEEIEALNGSEPSAPLRLVKRIVTTTRRSGDDSYVSERQVFDLDVNGRLVLSGTESSTSK